LTHIILKLYFQKSSDEAMQDAAPGIGNAAPQHINAAMLGAMQDMLAERDDGLVGVRAELTPDRETLNPVEAAALQQLLATSDSSDSSLLWSDVSIQ
jgi:hypothetical protein